jgi:hypothetical protein
MNELTFEELSELYSDTIISLRVSVSNLDCLSTIADIQPEIDDLCTLLKRLETKLESFNNLRTNHLS